MSCHSGSAVVGMVVDSTAGTADPTLADPTSADLTLGRVGLGGERLRSRAVVAVRCCMLDAPLLMGLMSSGDWLLCRGDRLRVGLGVPIS